MAKIIEEDEIPERKRGVYRYPWAKWVKMLGDASVGTVLELEKKDFPEGSWVYDHWEKPDKRSALAQQAKSFDLVLITRGSAVYLRLKDQRVGG